MLAAILVLFMQAGFTRYGEETILLRDPGLRFPGLRAVDAEQLRIRPATNLDSVDLASGEVRRAHIERSDVAIIPRAAVVGEAMLAIAMADALLADMGGDTIGDVKAAVRRRRRRSEGPRGAQAAGSLESLQPLRLSTTAAAAIAAMRPEMTASGRSTTTKATMICAQSGQSTAAFR